MNLVCLQEDHVIKVELVGNSHKEADLTQNKTRLKIES